MRIDGRLWWSALVGVALAGANASCRVAVPGTLATTSPARDSVYSELQVDRQAQLLPGGHLAYPEELRRKNVEGSVLMQFVVSARGRVEMKTVRVVRSSDPLFLEAVRRFLSGAQFQPAELGGRQVRQLVQQPFDFTLQR